MGYRLPSSSNILWYPGPSGYPTHDRDVFYDYLDSSHREPAYESLPRRPPSYSPPRYGYGNIDRPASRYYLPPLPVHTVLHPIQSTVERNEPSPGFTLVPRESSTARLLCLVLIIVLAVGGVFGGIAYAIISTQ